MMLAQLPCSLSAASVQNTRTLGIYMATLLLLWTLKLLNCTHLHCLKK